MLAPNFEKKHKINMLYANKKEFIWTVIGFLLNLHVRVVDSRFVLI